MPRRKRTTSKRAQDKARMGGWFAKRVSEDEMCQMVSMDGPNEQSSTTTATFKRFQKLPLELQSIIWQLAIEAEDQDRVERHFVNVGLGADKVWMWSPEFYTVGAVCRVSRMLALQATKKKTDQAGGENTLPGYEMFVDEWIAMWVVWGVVLDALIKASKDITVAIWPCPEFWDAEVEEDEEEWVLEHQRCCLDMRNSWSSAEWLGKREATLNNFPRYFRNPRGGEVFLAGRSDSHEPTTQELYPWDPTAAKPEAPITDWFREGLSAAEMSLKLERKREIEDISDLYETDFLRHNADEEKQIAKEEERERLRLLPFTKTFHDFMKLPEHLQNKIWHHAMDEENPGEEYPYFLNLDHHEGGHEWMCGEDVYVVRAVCRSSRLLALRGWLAEIDGLALAFEAGEGGWLYAWDRWRVVLRELIRATEEGRRPKPTCLDFWYDGPHIRGQQQVLDHRGCCLDLDVVLIARGGEEVVNG